MWWSNIHIKTTKKVTLFKFTRQVLIFRVDSIGKMMVRVAMRRFVRSDRIDNVQKFRVFLQIIVFDGDWRRWRVLNIAVEDFLHETVVRDNRLFFQVADESMCGARENQIED